MAPVGLKPNFPDYRFRKGTSSKWDFNPYIHGAHYAPRGRMGAGERTEPRTAPARPVLTCANGDRSPAASPSQQPGFLFALFIYF